MRKVVLLAVALAMGPQMASAQLGNGGGQFAGVDVFSDPSRHVMHSFVEASRTTLAGSVSLLKAVDQKASADEAGAAAALLTEDMTRQQAEEVMAGEVRALSTIGKALASGAKNDPAQLNEGLALLGQALSQFDAVLRDLPELKNVMRKSKSRDNGPAMFVAKALPDATGDMRREIRVLAEASRKAGATVPDALLAN